MAGIAPSQDWETKTLNSRGPKPKKGANAEQQANRARQVGQNVESVRSKFYTHLSS